MFDSKDLIPPTSLFIEYKSESLMIKGIILIVTSISVITVLIIEDFQKNVIGVIAVGGLLFVSLLMIRKALTPMALLITDKGVKVKNNNDIHWDSVTKFYVKKTSSDGFEEEELMIETKEKDYKFDLADLEVERARLDRWITFYRRRKSMIASR